jgi:hypothetical protein
VELSGAGAKARRIADAFEGVEEALDRVLGVNEVSTNGRVTTEQNGNGSGKASAANRIAGPVLVR